MFNLNVTCNSLPSLVHNHDPGALYSSAIFDVMMDLDLAT